MNTDIKNKRTLLQLVIRFLFCTGVESTIHANTHTFKTLRFIEKYF